MTGTATSHGDIVIRPATRADARELGKLGAMLLRTHYAFDPQRFMSPGEAPDAGYGRFLASQIGSDESAVFVADRGGEVLGYVYVSLEPQSWKELREAAGFIHDVGVAEHGRRLGIARALVDTAIAWLREQGAPRVLLWSAAPNDAAQRLFESLGFRRTMVEMTREL